MLDNELELTIEELAERVGIPVRTIRFYIAEGLLPGPGTRGKAASYGEEQLLRLRLIRRLSEQRVPLVEMRDMLSRLLPDEVRALLETEDQQAAVVEQARAQAAQVPSPKEYVAALLNRVRPSPSGEKVGSASGPLPSLPSQPVPQHKPSLPYTKQSTSASAEVWNRWELAPGVELHVKADTQNIHRVLIERLLKAGGILS